MAQGVPLPEQASVPAIILHGETIAAMPDGRRQEVAAALEQLLGFRAAVREVAADLLADAAEAGQVLPEPGEPLPPFTILGENESWGIPNFDGSISTLCWQSMLPAEDEALTKRALKFVATRAYRPTKIDTMWPFTFHFYPDDGNGHRNMRAVTFDDPQALIDRPQEVADNFNGLGPKTVKALAQFAAAVTTARTLER
jgi:hypothetical protein